MASGNVRRGFHRRLAREHAEDFFRAAVCEDFFRGAAHDDALVHQYNLVCVLSHHVEVMRDEDDGHILFFAQICDNLIEELKTVLVDAGYRLVEQQKVRHRVEGQCQEHTLELAARKCAEPAVDEVSRTHALQTLEHARTQRLGRAEPDGPL